MHEHDTRDDAIQSLEQQVMRLREALLTIAWMFDRERRKTSPYYPRALSGDGCAELGLEPDDIDPAAQYPLDDLEATDDR